MSQFPLSAAERDGIVTAVKSVFARLRVLYAQIGPTFEKAGFAPPSPGVLARDISEKIETAIVQHGATFARGPGFVDLARSGCEWEVKIRKGSGVTINGCKRVAGETYIVANYTADVEVREVWVLWEADEAMFSPRRSNSQARRFRAGQAPARIDVLFTTGPRRPRRRRLSEPDLFGAVT